MNVETLVVVFIVNGLKVSVLEPYTVLYILSVPNFKTKLKFALVVTDFGVVNVIVLVGIVELY